MRANEPGTSFEALRGAPLAIALARAAAPVRVWLVGGAVRDAALGRGILGGLADLDAVVGSDAAAIAARVAAALGGRVVRLGSDRFGAVRVVARAGELDLWDLEGAPLAPDLERRDFTVNAVALDLASGELVDPHRGLEDLRARVLRATRPSVFAEDPLRVVRLARFAATLEGFTCEPATVALSRASAAALANVPGERIRQELSRLWRDSTFARAAHALAESGTWPELWRDPESTSPFASPEDFVSSAQRLDRALVASGPEDSSKKTKASIEGKTARSVVTGHVLAALAAAGRGRAGAVLRRLAEIAALSRAELRDALLLLTLSGEAVPSNDADLAWFVHRAGAGYPFALGLASGCASSASSAERWLAAAERASRLVCARGESILTPRPLLTGEEIGSLLGLAPGPELGAAVRRLSEAQVRGAISTILEAKTLLAGTGRGGT